MCKVIDFNGEKLKKGIEEIINDTKNSTTEQMVHETYRYTLYKYLRGQASEVFHRGWLRGVEYMMDACGINYKTIWKEVQTQILQEGKEIVNKEYFDVD